jgi:hypothetical protein
VEASATRNQVQAELAQVIPSATELAKEMAEQNGCCGHIEAEGICLRRPKQHDGECQYEPIRQVIPFE